MLKSINSTKTDIHGSINYYKINSNVSTLNYFTYFNQFIYFTIISLCSALIFFFLDYNDPKWRALYVLIIIVATWIINYVDIIIVGFFPLILGPAHGIMPMGELFLTYFSNMTLLYTSAAMLGGALRKQALEKRFALFMMRGSSHQMYDLTLRIALICFFISNWISDTATMVLLLPIVKRILELIEVYYKAIEDEGLEDPRVFKPPKSNLSFKQLKTVTYLVLSNSCAAGGPGTMIGATTNLAFLGQFQLFFPGDTSGLTFATWLIYNWPLMFMILISGWFAMVICWEGPRFFKDLMIYWIKSFYYLIKREDPNKNIPGVKEYFKKANEALDVMESWKFGEKILCIIFPSIILLLFFRRPNLGSLYGWDSLFGGGGFTEDAMITTFFAILLFFIPCHSIYYIRETIRKNPDSTLETKTRLLNERLLSWTDATKSVEWGIIWVFGGGFAIAALLQSTGLDIYLADVVTSGIDHLSNQVVIIIILCTGSLATELMSSTNIVAILTPIVVNIALARNMNPLMLGLNTLLAANCGSLFPISTTTNVLAYKSTTITIADMFRGGLLFKILQIIIIYLHINVLGEVIFKFSEFPQWAIDYKERNMLNVT